MHPFVHPGSGKAQHVMGGLSIGVVIQVVFLLHLSLLFSFSSDSICLCFLISFFYCHLRQWMIHFLWGAIWKFLVIGKNLLCLTFLSDCLTVSFVFFLWIGLLLLLHLRWMIDFLVLTRSQGFPFSFFQWQCSDKVTSGPLTSRRKIVLFWILLSR